MPLSLSILLTGCTLKSDPEVKYITQVQEVKLNIPKELLECQDIKVDSNKITKQSDVANLLVDLDEAYNDCKEKLKSIKNLVD